MLKFQVQCKREYTLIVHRWWEDVFLGGGSGTVVPLLRGAASASPLASLPHRRRHASHESFQGRPKEGKNQTTQCPADGAGLVLGRGTGKMTECETRSRPMRLQAPQSRAQPLPHHFQDAPGGFWRRLGPFPTARRSPSEPFFNQTKQNVFAASIPLTVRVSKTPNVSPKGQGQNILRLSNRFKLVLIDVRQSVCKQKHSVGYRALRSFTHQRSAQ